MLRQWSISKQWQNKKLELSWDKPSMSFVNGQFIT